MSLGAQSIVVARFLQKLPGYIDALEDGNTHWRQMLANSSFTLSPQDAQSGGNANGLTIWGKGDYSDLGGRDDSLDWEGEVLSAQLGIDKRIGDNLLLGSLVSWSGSDVNANLLIGTAREQGQLQTQNNQHSTPIWLGLVIVCGYGVVWAMVRANLT